MLSDEKVKEIMFDIEKSDDVHRYKIDGVSMYHLLRFPLEIDLRIGSNSKPVQTLQRSVFTRIGNRVNAGIQKFRKQKNINAFSALFDKRESALPSPVLFVSPSSYLNIKRIGPHLIDIITYYHKQGLTINFIQRKDFSVSAFPAKSPYYHRFLPLDLNYNEELPANTYDDLRAFLELISEKTKMDYSARADSYSSFLKRIFGEARQLAWYIEKTKARYLFTYSVYTEPGIVLACRQTNTTLIEVQHGVVLDNTIYFQSALDKTRIGRRDLLMPDYILALGNEWKRIITGQQSFFDATNTFVIGSSGFDKWRKSSEAKNNNDAVCIVFFSQGRSYNDINSISKFIEDFLDKYGLQIKELNMRVVVRPHPNDKEELTYLAHKYPTLIVVEDPSKVNSLESIAAADFVFAASSMCLYEAISFGKCAISLEKFSGVVQREHIRLVKTIEELFCLISEDGYREHTRQWVPYLESFNPGILDKLVN